MVRGFAGVAYVAFQASFLYFIAFVIGYVPMRDRGDGVVAAIAIDAGLIALFGVTHSIMARAGFKRWIIRFIPAAAERSLFVLVASLQVALLCWQWRPVAGPTLWSAAPPLATVLTGVQLAGFAIALASSLLIDHFELFGLRQAFAPRREALPFHTPLLYRIVRHP